MLHPPRFRVDLGKFLLGYLDDLSFKIINDGTGTGGALIKR